MVEGTPLSAGVGERTALEEWAVLVDAMARGDIFAMVRKGGIRELRADTNTLVRIAHVR